MGGGVQNRGACMYIFLFPAKHIGAVLSLIKGDGTGLTPDSRLSTHNEIRVRNGEIGAFEGSTFI